MNGLTRVAFDFFYPAGSTVLDYLLFLLVPPAWNAACHRHWPSGFRVLLTTLGIWPHRASQCVLMTSLFLTLYWWPNSFPVYIMVSLFSSVYWWPHCAYQCELMTSLYSPLCTDDLTVLLTVYLWPHYASHCVLMTSLLPSMYWWLCCLFPCVLMVSLFPSVYWWPHCFQVCTDEHLQRLCFAKPVLKFYLLNFQKLLLSSSYLKKTSFWKPESSDLHIAACLLHLY